MSFSYKWIKNIGEFQAIAPEWDNALIKSGEYNPFLLADFIITWWKYFGRGLNLYFFVAFDNEEIIGGIPLYLKIAGYRQCRAGILRYIGDSAANYTEPLYAAKKPFFLSLFKQALEETRGWDIVYLPELREDNLLMQEYRNNPRPDKKFICYTILDHFNWAIDLSAGKETYLRTISRDLLNDLRVKRNHAIKTIGPLKLVAIKGDDGVSRYFDVYAKFSVQAFKDRSRNSNFENNRYVDFFREFLLDMEDKNMLDTHVLFAGDTILAISFAYRFGKGFNWVLTGFNYEYKYLRPGYLLIEALLEEILQRKETYFNWYGYERLLKRQWCNCKEPLYRFYLTRRSFKTFCFRNLQRLEQVIRQNKIIFDAISRIKKIHR